VTTTTETLSGKTSRDENFPIASWLLSEERRVPILAYYRFARAADDVADHPDLSADEKLALLDRLQDALCGRGPPDPEAEPLRIQLREHGLSPRHALELLDAFRQDVRKSRYADWAELMDYCKLSAAPVGRFVLDVHEEDERLWPASDALCSALQVINHLQDCAKDYARLGRVYLPEEILRLKGASVTMLSSPTAPPALRDALADIARRASELVARSAPLIAEINDVRLAAEIAAIHALARRLARDLEMRDPLSERVRLGKASLAFVGGLAALKSFAGAMIRSIRRAAKSRGVTMQTAPAARSSFYFGMRVLSKGRREAMFALYRFCRAVDDVADECGSATPAQRLAELDRWRADVAAMYEGRPSPRLTDLVQPVRNCDLQRKDFEAVIDGMAMDAEGHMRAPDWKTLDLYCDRVASAVGRLSVRIFGLPGEQGEALAFHLGRALQLINILRDIDEDAAIGRLYLPREALRAAGVTADDPLKAAADPKLGSACLEVATRARMHFDKAHAIMDAAPRAAVRAPRLMAAVYGSIFDKMVAEGFAPPRKRAKASRLRVFAAFLRYGVL
jgi:squalene synthase HpnD/squalene synthase HpnC